MTKVTFVTLFLTPLLIKDWKFTSKKTKEFQDKWHIRSKVKKSVTNVTFVTKGQNVSYMVIFKGDTFEIDVSQRDILISNCRDKSLKSVTFENHHITDILSFCDKRDVCDAYFHLWPYMPFTLKFLIFFWGELSIFLYIKSVEKRVTNVTFVTTIWY